jgi:hypothetical protein
MNPRTERPPGSFRASVLACSLFATTASVMSVSGCATTDETFHLIVGASMRSDVRPCSDYASHNTYLGTPYYIQNPESGKVTRRHEGIDFCTDSGSEVIAAANGIVVNIVQDNPHHGGRVTIRTSIEFRDYTRTENLHLDALHITPKVDLKLGDAVKAGQVIGYTQPPGKPAIGPRSHVHFSAGPTPSTWIMHTDPNRFWQKGPGIISCFNPSSPPSDAQVVAPIKC